jgi:collagenase-like PrtC family protease
MRLSVAPIAYAWDEAQIADFYAALRASAADVIYLGETVCPKRRSHARCDWLALARELAATGRQVVLSTYALVEAGSELATVRRLCRNGEFLVEANEMGAVQLLAEQGLPFVGGPGLNLYNARALALLQRRGLVRWVPPVELSGAALGEMLAEVRELGLDADLETEVFACGRLPLAHSARCFTARHHGLSKDACELACASYPEGLPAYSQEGEPLFTLNGIQVQSAQRQHLLPHWRELRDLGVGLLRVSPERAGMAELLHAYRTVLDGGDRDPALAELLGDAVCDGYWRGDAGIAAASV